jgi:hypothetical protein
VSGALYFNSTANEMRVYDGANWIPASSAGGVSLLSYSYTATAGQTTFSGADDNAATLSYVQQNLIVTLNGIVLEDGTDYTATNGTSIVLTTGAAAGDELNVIAFKSFTVADMVPASTGGTFSGNVAVNGNFNSDNTNNVGIYNAGATGSGNGTLVAETNGSERLRIDASGRVGIATSSPDRPVHLSGSGTRNYFKAETTGATNASESGLEIKTPSANWLINSLGGTDALIFYDLGNTQERMRIDSAGRVTMPYQPAFSAHLTASITNVTAGVIPFAGEHFDVGSCYNTSTYRFTAPVAGRYYFGVDFYATIRSGGLRVVHAAFRKNGSTEFEATMAGGTGGDGGYAGHPTVHSNACINLAENDYVDFFITNADYTGGFDFEPGTRASRFYGYLIG